MFNSGYYKSRKLVAIGADYFTQGGAWRSIFLYLKNQEALGVPVHLIDLRGGRAIRQFVAASLFAPKIIVNGLGSFQSWLVVFLCLFRRGVIIYLHETEYSLGVFAENNAMKFRLLEMIFRRNPILCVSKQAERLYRSRYNASITHVVYEYPGGLLVPELVKDKIHIVMVGSMDERKGVDLFSRVADLAAELNAAWQFHWVGGLASRGELYCSSNVCWHGWQWNPREIVKQVDLFFLSSNDDPCPLAALEALQLGKKAVVYQNTGIAEVIKGVDGCEVFDEYSVEAAHLAISRAVSVSLNVPQLMGRLEGTISMEAFDKAIRAVL